MQIILYIMSSERESEWLVGHWKETTVVTRIGIHDNMYMYTHYSLLVLLLVFLLLLLYLLSAADACERRRTQGKKKNKNIVCVIIDIIILSLPDGTLPPPADPLPRPKCSRDRLGPAVRSTVTAAAAAVVATGNANVIRAYAAHMAVHWSAAANSRTCPPHNCRMAVVVILSRPAAWANDHGGACPSGGRFRRRSPRLRAQRSNCARSTKNNRRLLAPFEFRGPTFITNLTRSLRHLHIM